MARSMPATAKPVANPTADAASGERIRPPSERSPQAERLMAVALELFSQRDFAAVTIKDIAGAARLNTAMIYYYFRSKEDLFRATLEHAVERALDNYRRLRERHDDPVDLIDDWIDTHAVLYKPIRQLVKIMLDYSGSGSQLAAVDRAIRAFYDEECSLLSSSIRRGIALGAFRTVDPARTAELISTHLDGVMVRSIIHRDFDIDRAFADLRQLVWRYLGYSPPAGMRPRRNKGARKVPRLMP